MREKQPLSDIIEDRLGAGHFLKEGQINSHPPTHPTRRSTRNVVLRHLIYRSLERICSYWRKNQPQYLPTNFVPKSLAKALLAETKLKDEISSARGYHHCLPSYGQPRKKNEAIKFKNY